MYYIRASFSYNVESTTVLVYQLKTYLKKCILGKLGLGKYSNYRFALQI